MAKYGPVRPNAAKRSQPRRRVITYQGLSVSLHPPKAPTGVRCASRIPLAPVWVVPAAWVPIRQAHPLFQEPT